MAIEVDVDVRALQRIVVRVEDENGDVLGTGFFAAPGRVLTNAHVVEERDKVRLRPEVPIGLLEGLGTVVARSPAKTDNEQPLWPFPDIAVIETEDFPGHPCALVDDNVVNLTSDFKKGCVSWGYPQRAGERKPSGDTVECSVVGPSSAVSPYWRVKGDWIGRGISGSPVVSRDRGSVVGILSATLDPKGPAGGWLVPLAEIAAAHDEHGPLGRHVERIIKDGQAAVNDRPERWSEVIKLSASVGPHQRVRGAPFERGPHTSPAELLLADNAIVDYLFYGEELKATETWAYHTDPLRVAVLSGAGGAGKSRFALELTLRLCGKGWACCDFGDLDEDDALTISAARLPRLIVVDYAEARSADVDRLLKRLVLGATAAAPARVLLLTREPADSAAWANRPSTTLPDSSDAGVRGVLGRRHTIDATTRTLSLAERRELYGTAVTQLSTTWTGAPQEAPETDLTDDQYSTALAVIYEALDIVLEPELPEGKMEPAQGPASRVLAHEARYWALSAPEDSNATEVECSIALATLFAGEHAREIPPLLESMGLPARQAKSLGTWAGNFYGSGSGVQPLRPDRLGEFLVERALVLESPAAGLEKLMRTATMRQCAHAIEVLARTAVHSDPVRRELTRLIRLLITDLTERAMVDKDADGARGASVLAAALIDLLTGPLATEILGTAGAPSMAI